MTLLRAFSLRQAPLDFDIDLQYQGLGQLDNCNIILIGSSRTSLLLRLLQPGGVFTLTECGVHIDGEQNNRYEDEMQSIAPDAADERQARIEKLAYERWKKTGDADSNNWRWAEDGISGRNPWKLIRPTNMRFSRVWPARTLDMSLL